MGNHLFVIGYQGRWVWLNLERIPTKTVMAHVVAEVEEICIVGEVAEKVIIPARTGKWVHVVAPPEIEGKVVTIAPKGKYKDNMDLLIANSVDEVEDGFVPAWVVNVSDKEVELEVFEGLAEVSECEIMSETCEKVHTEDDEGQAHFENSGFTLPDVSQVPETINPPMAKIRDMESKEGKLLWDILQKVQDEQDVTEPIWGVDLIDSVLTLEQRKSYAMIIQQFADIFAKDDEDLGRTFWVKHAIDTGDPAPLRG